MDTIVDIARRSVPDSGIEVFRQSWDEDSVNFEMDHIKEIKSQNATGYGLRIIKDGKLGFASATGAGYRDIVERALSTVPYGPRAKFSLPENPPGESHLQVYDPGIDTLDTGNMTRRGSELLEYMKSKKHEYQYDVYLNRYVESREILQSAFSAEYRKTIYSFSAVAHSYREGDFFNIADGFSCSVMDRAQREESEWDIVHRVLDLLTLTEKLAVVTTGSYPVIFSPGAFRDILESVLVGLNGSTVEKGSSPLGDKLEKKVFPESVTIYDDGTIQGSDRVLPFDDEGIAVRRRPLIEKGIIRNFVLDLQTAGALSMETTGNGRRGYSSMPSPSAHAVVFSYGDGDRDSLIRSVSDGLYVESLIGGHTGNFFTGDFQMNVDMGFRIIGGELTGRVKNVMLAGNTYKLFESLAESTTEQRWSGRYYLPFVLFEQVSVAAK